MFRRPQSLNGSEIKIICNNMQLDQSYDKIILCHFLILFYMNENYIFYKSFLLFISPWITYCNKQSHLPMSLSMDPPEHRAVQDTLRRHSSLRTLPSQLRLRCHCNKNPLIKESAHTTNGRTYTLHTLIHQTLNAQLLLPWQLYSS